MPSLEKARFGHLDQALYTKMVLWAGTGGIQRPGQMGSPTVEGSGLPKGKRRKVAICFAWMVGGHVLRCHVDFSMHVPDVGVIIGRWPACRQVRGRRCLQLPSEHLVTGSSSASDVVLRTCHGHYYTYVSALLFSYYVVRDL